MNDEELPVDKIGTFHWFKLFLTSAATIKWLIIGSMSLLGLGTVTNPAVQEKVMNLIDPVVKEEPLPIPAGYVPLAPTAAGPDHSAFHAQVRQSLASIKIAIDSHTAQLTQLRATVVEVEIQLAKESAYQDLQLDDRITVIEELVD